MLQAIKLTFGSVWGWLGIIVGALSLINLGVMYFEVGIGPVLERVVATYKAIVHQGFDYLFFWVNWKMPPWAKDVVAIYLIIGGAFLRAQTQFGNRADQKLAFNLRERTAALLLCWRDILHMVQTPRFIKEYFGETPEVVRVKKTERALRNLWISVTLVLLNLVLIPLTAVWLNKTG